MTANNQSAAYLRASLHRAINQGDKSLTVSTLDLKDTLAELERLQTQEDLSKPEAPLVGWADPAAIQQMRQGKVWSLSVTRKRVGARSQQICASAAQPTTAPGERA
ncbi:MULTISPECIES: hypothetical protein [Pseudomonas syringae group]|uniref:Uncharacterized protein n=1 Tax=Pseudomonas avellanae pv. morsprunorum TaxID=3380385 RepID=A0ABX4YUX2_9PSED|nr:MULTISPECIES: hypothetical protein [Pseudomonas syringae group]KWS53735.1 hypothetical protein AL055_10595 [Pseudomonas amygdali pv. morsprunorum]POC89015.1 hypothetical protein BKM26_18220 [Pseudomonas avellanae]POD06439.1 hypothetical protein BKM20_18245 [Pseudomonas avellanae]SPF10785.1 hypothetical protein PSCFBP3800_00715 [Pseudomonas syringae group genomosp. 3]